MASSPGSIRGGNGATAATQLQKLVTDLFTSDQYDTAFVLLMVFFECILSFAIIRFISYTEIDWIAYMQEVTAYFDENITDYRLIRGNTGPLVYPAGFVYLYGALRSMTDNGTNVRVAQYLYAGVYVTQQSMVLYIYSKLMQELIRTTSIITTTKSGSNQQQYHIRFVFRAVMIAMCLSKRLHSIYMLRLFNDCVTMMLFYGSCLLLTMAYTTTSRYRKQWNVLCVVYSLAVSTKMNVLLFAPGLLYLMLQESASLYDTAYRLILYCGVPQLLLGYPFLSTHPVSYLSKAFELDRSFFYIWTVNWKVRRRRFFCGTICVDSLYKCLIFSSKLRSLLYVYLSAHDSFYQKKCSYPNRGPYYCYSAIFRPWVYWRTNGTNIAAAAVVNND